MNYLFLLLPILLLTSACNTIQVPSSHPQPSSGEYPVHPYGSYTEVLLTEDEEGAFLQKYEGELISIEDYQLILYNHGADTTYMMPIGLVQKVRISEFDAQAGSIIPSTILGIIISGTHGSLFYYSASAWIFGSAISGMIYHNEAVHILERPIRFNDIRHFARFPAGVPEGFPLTDEPWEEDKLNGE